MSMRRALLLLLIVVSVLLPAAVAAVESVPIGELLGGAPAFDRQRITVEGEALGDVLRRGEYGWINIGDGSGVIGIWAPVAALDGIGRTGVNGRVGDQVRVTGTFFQADPALGGDTAIEAESLAVIAPGYDQARPIPALRVLLALAAMALAGGLAYIWQRRRPA